MLYFPNGLPSIPLSTNIATLKAHPSYKAAKRGCDANAAFEVVRDLYKPKKLEALAERLCGQSLLVAPVQRVETKAAHYNLLPLALAYCVADTLGGEVTTGIRQTTPSPRTGASLLERIAQPPEFEGVIAMSRPYVLTDDVVASGSTLAGLMRHIHAQGGRVAAAVTLAGGYGSARLDPSEGALAALRSSYGFIEDSWRAVFGYGFEGLTERETRVLSRASQESLRAVIAQRERGQGATESYKVG